MVLAASITLSAPLSALIPAPAPPGIPGKTRAMASALIPMPSTIAPFIFLALIIDQVVYPCGETGKVPGGFKPFSVPIDELHRVIRRISVRRQMVILFAKCVDRDKAVVNRVPVSYQYSLF